MLLCHPREENIPHASGKKVATGDVSRSIAAEDHGHADGTLEFVAHGRFKNRRFLPVGGQSEFPVLHCEAIGSLKFGTRIFPGILREIFRGGFYRFKFHKNLGRTVLDSQRGADAPVLQTIKSDCRAGRGHEMIWVWLLFGNEKTAKNQVILGVAAAEMAGNSRVIEVREEYPLV